MSEIDFAPFRTLERYLRFAPHCTGDEAPRVAEVRRRVYDEMGLPKPPVFEDIEILHFLRDNSGDVDATVKVFAAHLTWRVENDMETVLERVPKELPQFAAMQAYWPGRLFGVDREGDLFQIDRLGAVDARSIFANLTRKEVETYHVWFQEEHQNLKRQHFAKTGHQVYAVTYVLDLAGLGLKHFSGPGLQLIIDCLKVDMAHWPDGIKTALVINAPSVFFMGWKLVTPMLSKLILDKVQIMGGDYKEALLEHIAEDQLPNSYGGQRDGDGPCKDPIPVGGVYGAIVPEDDDEAMEEVTVARRSVHTVEVDVPVAGCTVLYHWRLTSGSDIYFSATFEDATTPGVSNGLLPSRSYDDGRHMDALEISTPGKITFTWDNTGSILTSKVVKLVVTLLKPEHLGH